MGSVWGALRNQNAGSQSRCSCKPVAMAKRQPSRFSCRVVSFGSSMLLGPVRLVQISMCLRTQSPLKKKRKTDDILEFPAGCHLPRSLLGSRRSSFSGLSPIPEEGPGAGAEEAQLLPGVKAALAGVGDPARDLESRTLLPAAGEQAPLGGAVRWADVLPTIRSLEHGPCIVSFKCSKPCLDSCCTGQSLGTLMPHSV